MAKITAEKIEEINEVYAECGVKTKTAKLTGVSVASVSKYLRDDYIPKAQRQKLNTNIEIKGAEDYIRSLKEADNLDEAFRQSFFLTKEEWSELKELQKEAL